MAMPPRNNRKERSSPARQTQPPESQTQHNRKDIASSSSSSSAADNFSSPSIIIPPGFKFVPTDEDLLLYYLKPFLKTNKISWPSIPIHLVNIYESNPEQLSKRYEKGNVKEWFFITERKKVREGAKKQNRNDNNGGCWRSTTAAKKIEAGDGVVGYKTKLEYFTGKNGNGLKSDWLMNEYCLEQNSDSKKKVDHALCKIFLTPRAMKRKAEEEENEKKKKKKKEEGVATAVVQEVVDQPRSVAFQNPRFSLCQQQDQHNHTYPPQQPQNQVQHEQPPNVVSQQPRQPLFCLVPVDLIPPEVEEQQQSPVQPIFDETEMTSFPDDDFSHYFVDFISLLDGVEVSSNLEDIFTERF